VDKKFARKTVKGKEGLMTKGKKGTGKRELITKQDAIDFLKLGCKPKEIAECFSGFTKMQLAAFQAHLTMGTYDK
jgi:hypothetical protein